VRGPLGESWGAWTALGVGVLAVTAHSAFSFAASVLMLPMIEEFGWSRSDFALAMNVRMFALVATIAFAGQLTDRFGAKRVLVAGALIVGASIFAMSEAGSWLQLMGVGLLMGPGQAALGAVAASALVLRRFERNQGLAVGILNGGDNLLNSLVPLATAALLGIVGWRQTIATLGGAYVVLAILIMFVLPDADAATTSESKAPLRDVPWRDRRFWLLIAAYAAIYAWVTSLQLHFHAYQTDIGRSGSAASMLNGVWTLVGAAGAPLFGLVSQRVSARAALTVVVAGLAVSAAVLAATSDVSLLTLWAVFYGLVNGGAVALLALVLHELFGKERIGRLMGVAMVFCMTATMLGNQWSAWVFDVVGSYLPVWWGYALLMLVTLVPVELLRRAPANP
jgi:MFS family permease